MAAAWLIRVRILRLLASVAIGVANIAADLAASLV